jgi:quercetin dioxygenase-like cupin family protein
MNKAFSSYPWKNGKIADLSDKFPSYLSAWDLGLQLDHADTHYIYCYEGSTILNWEGISFRLQTGMYACLPGVGSVVGGRGIVVSRKGYRGMFSIGGPAEHEGRLKYIDGCTDSLLIPPVMLGDPCLNLLYFPPGIDQTAHTHPSDRIGIVMSGKGQCVAVNDGVEESIALEAGMIWVIHTDGVHKFQTPHGEHLRVLAYHPDSDYGPTHQFHPMLNRTIVDGVSAKDLPEIQTK